MISDNIYKLLISKDEVNNKLGLELLRGNFNNDKIVKLILACWDWRIQYKYLEVSVKTSTPAPKYKLQKKWRNNNTQHIKTLAV